MGDVGVKECLLSPPLTPNGKKLLSDFKLSCTIIAIRKEKLLESNEKFYKKSLDQK